ncbi:MAG: hypothetical protein LBU45_08410 [Azoarcus sp.]|jgi:hypothetical protein|nr:hypothetical protein [Azoarcus sp.]
MKSQKSQYCRFARYAAAVLLCLIPTIAPAEGTQDILGIQTGMTVEQAEALISKARPGTNKEAVRNHAGKPLGFRYIDTDNPEKRLGKTQIVLGVASNGRIWFIGQAQNFEIGQRPDYVTLQKSLLDKYGPPTKPGPEQPPAKYLRIKYGMLWSFDARQKPLRTDANYSLSQDPCSESFVGDNYSQTWGAYIIVPRQTDARCGKAITASVSFDAESRRVAAFSVTIADTAALFADTVYGAESKALVEKKQKLEQKSRANLRVDL